MTWVLLVVCAAATLAGCGKPPTPPAPSDGSSPAAASYDPRKDPLVNPPALLEAAPDDRSGVDEQATLFMTLRGSPNTLNPLFVSSMYDFTVVDSLFAGPFTFDKSMTWQVNEEMVESFEESEDHTTFTVKLKPGLKWQDGHPFTAHDIAYSWKEILDPRVPCQTQKPSVEPITECTAIDDLTVKYVQAKPLATRYWNLLFPIIPKHMFEKEKEKNPDLKTGDYYNQLARRPVSNGPYRIVEWVENEKIVVERWEDYHGKKPYFKRIVFRIIPDTNISLLSFEKQDVDWVELSAQQFALETNTDKFKAVGHKGWAPEWAFAYIGYNMDGSNPFFTDKRVRYAMTHALNLPLIFDKLLYNLVTPCHGNYHPDSWMYNPEVKLLEYDLEKSKQLLDEAGWTVDEKDGWRYKTVDGQKVAFEFTLLMSQGSPTAPKIAAVFQEDLQRIGVRMKTREFEWATFLEKVQNHEFQASTAAWGTGTDPDTGWNLWRTEEYKTGRNYGGYSNPEIDRLFEEGRAEFDFEKRKRIYQKIHKIIYDDQPYTWMYNAPTLDAFNQRIRGVQFSPRGSTGFSPSYFAWWTPAAGRAAAAVRPLP